jgi:hypothetical protein
MIIGLAVAAYGFAYVSVGDTYKSGSRVEKIEAKAPVVQVTPVVKGPVVRERFQRNRSHSTGASERT